jgi:DNA-binding IclR family transcriptional regulator
MNNRITIQTRVLRCLDGSVERTVGQIANMLALPTNSVHARLNELHHIGTIEPCGRGPRTSTTARGPMPTLWRIKPKTTEA